MVEHSPKILASEEKPPPPQPPYSFLMFQPTSISVGTATLPNQLYTVVHTFTTVLFV